MQDLSLQLEMLEEVAAPSDARDFAVGFGVGLGIFWTTIAIASFT